MSPWKSVHVSLGKPTPNNMQVKDDHMLPQVYSIIHDKFTFAVSTPKQSSEPQVFHLSPFPPSHLTYLLNPVLYFGNLSHSCIYLTLFTPISQVTLVALFTLVILVT